MWPRDIIWTDASLYHPRHPREVYELGESFESERLQNANAACFLRKLLRVVAFREGGEIQRFLAPTSHVIDLIKSTVRDRDMVVQQNTLGNTVA